MIGSQYIIYKTDKSRTLAPERQGSNPISTFSLHCVGHLLNLSVPQFSHKAHDSPYRVGWWKELIVGICKALQRVPGTKEPLVKQLLKYI